MNFIQSYSGSKRAITLFWICTAIFAALPAQEHNQRAAFNILSNEILGDHSFAFEGYGDDTASSSFADERTDKSNDDSPDDTDDDSENNVIEHLSYDFYPTSCTAILGETGAGKTTMVRMILALLQPNSGKVEIYNEKEHHDLSPLLRTNFVYVPQGNTLMSGTIRDNLRLGKLDATDDEMAEALKRSCADFVFELPDGLDTKCTEQGGGLSEGQAQRISIARALLRNRSIMLFDEATSALDPDTERKLLQNILSKRDKTIIFITHRPAVMEYCDQTIEIKKRHSCREYIKERQV